MAAPTLEDMAKWPLPQYDNPTDTLYDAILGIEIPMITLMTVFVAGRFASRTLIVKGALGKDDWTILVAYILAIAQCAIHIWEMDVGIGRHLYDVRFEWIPTIGKAALVTQVLFGPTCALTKISCCLTYLRIFPSKTNKCFCWCSIAFLTGFAIAVTTGMLAQCRPISDNWDVLKTHKNCSDVRAFFIAVAVINSVTDIAVYLWPIHYLINVNMALRQRVGLIICFSIGCITSAAGIARVVWMVKFFESWDQSWNGAIVYICLTIETSLGIVCACLPGVRPIISKLFPKILRSTAAPSGALSGPNPSWGKNLKASNISSQMSSKGYHDLESIHVTKDIELSVSTRPVEPQARKHEISRPMRRSEEEDWAYNHRDQWSSLNKH